MIHRHMDNKQQQEKKQGQADSDKIAINKVKNKPT